MRRTSLYCLVMLYALLVFFHNHSLSFGSDDHSANEELKSEEIAQTTRHYLLITNNDFASASQPLVDKHINQGPSSDFTPARPTYTNVSERLHVVRGKANEAIFVSDEAQWLNRTGQPCIPWRVLTVLLPPNVELSTVSACMRHSRFESVAGTWNVLPTGPMTTLKKGRTMVLCPVGRDIVDGRDIDIYEKDSFWPNDQVKPLGTGQLQNWKLTEVAVPLARYNPVRSELLLLVEAEIGVSFDLATRMTARSTSQFLLSRIGESRVKQIAVNYEQARSYYKVATPSQLSSLERSEPHGYTIITDSEIKGSSKILDSFVEHKKSIGFNVNVITEADFGGGIGDEAAENIRAWLQGHYIQDSLRYVLLIGDPRPEIGTVPMKMVGPASYDPNGKWVASDFYYAELTGNWDLDGDGYYGEWPDANGFDGDFGPGGIDRYWEVLVGRIPCYQAEEGSRYAESIQHLDAILSKTMWYETQTEDSPEWRRNVLLASTVDSGCFFPEHIKNDILVPYGWSFHRVYQEDYGLIPPPETSPCNADNVTDVWSSGQFGLVVWFAHGWGRGAGDIIDVGRVPELNDAYPCFTFQMSCGNARPDVTNNLAYELLKNGAVCTVGATRTVWNCLGPHSCAGWMAWEYTSRIVSGLTCGESLYDLKQTIPAEATGRWQNYKAFNIYGDPSLRIIQSVRTVRFVDINAFGRNDGSSWSDAYNNLQDALAAASWGNELWVAEGNYKPDRGTGITPGDRSATFQLKNGVTIYGGFVSGGGAWEDRDPIRYKTILSGDLDGNDGLVSANNAENSYHVVTADSYVYAPATLDGFIITAGNSNGSDTHGAGIYCRRSDLTIANCTIHGNTSNESGGGIYCRNSNPTFINCTISDNSTDNYGGGIDINVGSNPILRNCTIIGNSAAKFGGGIFSRHETNPTLINCTLSGNLAKRRGGGIYARSTCSLKIMNCIFWINTDKTGISESAQINGGTLNIYYCCIQDWTGLLGGTGNIDTDPLFTDPDYGDYHLKSEVGRWDPESESWVEDRVTSPCIDAGDPNSDWTAEPWPHGERINMGAYGGTPEASMSLSTVGNVVDFSYIK